MVFGAFQECPRYFLSVMGSDDNALTAEFGDMAQTVWLFSLREVSAWPVCKCSSRWQWASTVLRALDISFQWESRAEARAREGLS